MKAKVIEYRSDVCHLIAWTGHYQSFKESYSVVLPFSIVK